MKQCWRVFLVPVLMVCGAALAFAQNQVPSREWKEYSYADDGFAFTVPSKPVFQKQ